MAKKEAKEEKATEEKATEKMAEKEEPSKEVEKPTKAEKEEKPEEASKKEEFGEEKPAKKKKPKKQKKVYVEKAPKELTETIVHLANEGKTTSEIGMLLREQHNIGKVAKITGKKITQILEENKLGPKIPEDLMNLIRKSVALRDHMEKNKKDMSAKRGLMLTVSKIRALEKYYKKKGKLPLTWRYTAEKAALLAK